MHGAAGLSAQDPFNGSAAKKFVSSANELEALCGSIDEEKLKGFW